MRAPIWLLLLLTVASSACAPAVDLTKGLQVVDASTGLIDVGIVNGQNKLVPSITFKLKNLSDQKLIALVELDKVVRPTTRAVRRRR